MDLYREFFENAYFEPNTISKQLMGNKQCLKEHFDFYFFCLSWEGFEYICILKGGRGSSGKGEVDYRS